MPHDKSEAPPQTFPVLGEREPHRDRGKQILQAHPEILNYRGTNPYGVLAIVFLVLVQLVSAWMVAHQAWWVVVIMAVSVGAFANNGLWMMIHECSHNLMFRKPYLNSLAGIMANLPQVIPGSVAFQRYHLQHHANQGIYKRDSDIPRLWEAKLVGNSSVRKCIWLFLLPVILMLRPLGVEGVGLFNRWFFLNVLVQVACDVSIFVTLGPAALVYLTLSFLFSLGLHPLGGRWIQEHYLFAPPQDTYSYYGPLNSVAFNIGYHNEHHDFPWIPWNALPEVKKAAPEVYDQLVSHRSWTMLVVRFLADRRISLFSRLLRIEQPPDPIRGFRYEMRADRG
jgi:sphingolipid delta-4 desaturase